MITGTACLNIRKICLFLTQCIFMLSEPIRVEMIFPGTALTILFGKDNQCVYCELEREVVHITAINCRLQKFREILFLVVDQLQFT